MRSSPHSQRGVAFLAFVAILTAVSLLFVLGQSAWQSRQRINQLPKIRASRVVQAASALRSWYELNAPAIDALGATSPSGEELLAAAGVPRQWLLNAAISEPQVRGQIRYRVIAVWGDADDSQTPIFDSATGALNLCPDGGCAPRASARIEGFEIQSALYASTVRSLNALAIAAQAYFHAYWLADPDHNLSGNYFRGCSAPPSTLPCIESWEPLSSSSLLTELGEPGSRAKDGWGADIMAMNGGANDDAPPFKLAFRATTPWGDPIVVYALQRL